MGIWDEIKSKFNSEHQKATVNILYTSNRLYEVHSNSLKKFGLTPEQYNILRILRGQHPKPATVNLLIERMLNKMSNASRLVDKLVLKKMVIRKTCKEDRRAVDVLITQKGLDLLLMLEKAEVVWLKEISVLSNAEAKELNRLLDKIRSK